MRGDGTDLDAVLERALAGDPRGVARLISLVENTASADAGRLRREIAAALSPSGGRAHVVGLTGAPGVGKSTTTSALIDVLRARGRRIGVLAVDPSSPFTGGALLGDRIRMQQHAGDDGVFIRSMASRGQLGGLSAAVPQAVRVLDAAGCEVILVETVGVGQAEVEVAALADTTLVVLAPGLGDGIQAAKAGIIEIADVFVVNKADRDGAAQVARDLRSMQTLAYDAGRSADEAARWRAPIVSTVASAGDGVAELAAAIDAHREWLAESGALARRRRARAAAEIEAIALGELRARFAELHASAALAAAAADVAEGGGDPYAAADELLAAIDQTGRTTQVTRRPSA